MKLRKYFQTEDNFFLIFFDDKKIIRNTQKIEITANKGVENWNLFEPIFKIKKMKHLDGYFIDWFGIS